MARFQFRDYTRSAPQRLLDAGELHSFVMRMVAFQTFQELELPGGSHAFQTYVETLDPDDESVSSAGATARRVVSNIHWVGRANNHAVTAITTQEWLTAGTTVQGADYIARALLYIHSKWMRNNVAQRSPARQQAFDRCMAGGGPQRKRRKSKRDPDHHDSGQAEEATGPRYQQPLTRSQTR